MPFGFLFFHSFLNKFLFIVSAFPKGSSDSSITNVKVNDLDLIVKNCPVEKIITNGKAANRYYHQYFDYNLPVIQLPSTSPANAMYSLEKLIEKWKVILWKEI